MRNQTREKLYLTAFWLCVVFGIGCILVAATITGSEPPSRENYEVFFASFLGLIPLVVLVVVRRWWLWLTAGASAPSRAERRSPAENWMPHDQEEAGPKTTAWVEEKLRQAKKS